MYIYYIYIHVYVNYIYESTKATSKFSVPALCDSSGGAQELPADPASWSWLQALELGD